MLQREQNRNEVAEYLQGNRNPFIDHPEYACRIWGNYNDAAKSVCASQPAPTPDNPKPQTKKNGCGGNIGTTSVILTSLAAAGIAAVFISMIVRRKKKQS